MNVHPAKTEVKFSNERDVFRTVYHTVLDDLTAKGAPTNISITGAQAVESVRDAAAPRRDFFQTMDAKAYRAEAERDAKIYRAEAERDAQSSGTGWATVNRFRDTEAEAPPVSNVSIPHMTGVLDVSYADVSAVSRSESAQRLPERVDVSAKPTAALPGQRDILPETREAPWRIVGELFCTYIVCESASGDAYLIDKHAAHERVRFDQLKAGAEPPMRQALVTPLAVELSKEDTVLLLDNLETLEGLGFLCEDFGGGTVLVREVPSDLDPGDVAATLEELAEDLRTGHSPDERREAMFRTMACKSAIRGDSESSTQELRALVEKVQREEVRYCPHGRPVAVKITKLEIEKLFKRV